MDKTTFAGLTRLDPGENLSTDGYSFQSDNPSIIDRYLQVGAVGHRHDGHPALADPALDVVLAAVAGGGAILADESIFATYTLIDAEGGETKAVAAQTVTTAAALDPPDSGPTVNLDTTAGALLVNTYMYALTFTDGNGGETTLGPSVMLTRAPGPANARVVISGLSAVLTAAGAAGWRLWRSVGGGRFGFLAQGAGDGFTDDGSASPDCTMTPPVRNTTNGVNKVQVTVPGGQPAGTVQFRIYLSDDGSFETPAVAGTYPAADLGTVKEFVSLDLGTGRPPQTSRSIPGASRIDADTDLDNLHWRAPVADAAALPTVGNGEADVRVTLDDMALHVWNAATPGWQALGGGGGGGGGSSDPWHALGLHDPTWVQASSPLAADGQAVSAVEYFKDADGVVHLKGAAQATVDSYLLGIWMAFVPVGYRPAEIIRFVASFMDAGNGNRMIPVWGWVATDGGIVIAGSLNNTQTIARTTGDVFIMDGITFRAAP